MAEKVYAPAHYTRQPFRPVGALCLHCQHRPARPHLKWAHLATDYCSDSCKVNHKKQRERAAHTEAAEHIRAMLGLPGGRGPTFTRPELEAMARRLHRILPYGGLAMRAPRTMRRVRKRDAA